MTAPHSPSEASSVTSSNGHSALAPRERARALRGNKMKNGQSRQSSFSQQNRPDAMSYLVEGQANPPSPSQGPMHARHPSHLDWTYTDSPSHPQANSYPSPRSFGNQQRPADEWVASNWGMSPSAMTFDGHFPPGAPHPPFPNGHQPPDMARGHSGTSQFSPPFIQTNFPGPNSMHMPPFARLPLSGYELLAAKLAGSLGGPPVKPIYRRFAALGHRLMLHLQDELSELEDQLKALDAADTQSRQHPNGIFPASRRQESPNPNAPPSQRTELLGRIGYKICQYRESTPHRCFLDTLLMTPRASYLFIQRIAGAAVPNYARGPRI
jgi:hypothetical protein